MNECNSVTSGYLQVQNPQPNTCPGCGRCRQCGQPYPSYPYQTYPYWYSPTYAPNWNYQGSTGNYQGPLPQTTYTGI